MTIAVVLLLAGMTSLASGTGVLVATKVFLALMFGMLVPSACFMGWREDLSFSRAMISMGLGILPIGGLGMLCARYGIEVGHAVMPMVVLGVVITLYKPVHVTQRMAIKPWAVVYVLACFGSFAGYLWSSFEGAPFLTQYPLKTGDNITHLQHAFSFLRNTGYPPPSLANHGFVNAGHMLVQAWSASMTQSTGIALRTIYLCTSVWITLLASASVLFVLLDRWNVSESMRWYIPLVGWLLPMERLSEMKNALLALLLNTPALHSAIGPWWIQYHAPVTMYGLFLGMMVVLSLDHFQDRACARQHWIWLGRFSFFLFGIALAKQPQFPGVGMAAGIWSLYYLYHHRDSITISPFKSAWPLFAAAMTGMITLWITSSSQIDDVRLQWYFGYHLRSFAPLIWSRMIALMITYSFVGLALLDIMVARKSDVEPQRVLVLCLLLCPMIFPNIFIYMNYRASTPTPDYNILQASLPAFRIGWPLYIALVCRRIDGLSIRIKNIFATVLTAWGLCVLAMSLYALFVVADSQKELRKNYFGFETELKKNLASIPVKGSLIALNSSQRPYKTKRKLMFEELTVSHGHAMFSGNSTIDVAQITRAAELQERVLGTTEWNDSILCYAQKLGWTHYLVRKDHPYPSNIPLQKLSETSMFAVYAFGTPMLKNIEMGPTGLEKRLNAATEACELK